MTTSEFYTPTRDKIVADYLRDIALEIPDAVTGDGSDYLATGNALGNALLPIYANGEFNARESMPDLATDKGLTRWSRATGMPKLGEQFSEGTVIVSASFGTSVQDGQQLRNPATRALYKTVGDTAISPITLQGRAYVVALATGPASDLVSPATLEFISVPPGVSPTASVEAISGGAAAWSTPRWATEIMRSMRARAAAGNVAHIQALAMAVPGVEQAFVYPALRGSGTNDVIITTTAAAGTRIAGRSLLMKVSAAIRFGIRSPGGDLIPGLPAHTFNRTTISAVIQLPTNLLLRLKASKANPFTAWPPAPPVGADPLLYLYTVTASTSPTSFTVAAPGVGAPVKPAVGTTVCLFFPSVGFVKSTITSISAGASPWTITTAAWSSTPSETTVPGGSSIMPWSPMLAQLVAPHVVGSAGASGIISDYFASLGPGEMTPLLAGDVTRRCRWPRQSDKNPVSGVVEWPTDVGGRLASAIFDGTDAQDVSVAAMAGSVLTPPVPLASYIGTPPTVLRVGQLTVSPLP